jgi:hypothetical protein
MVLALNSVSGQIADVSPKMLLHPTFGKYLVPVEAGTKPYLAEMYRGGTIEDKIQSNKVSKEFVSKDVAAKEFLKQKQVTKELNPIEEEN